MSKALALALILCPVVAGRDRGGSNYGWYHLDPDCTRSPYGIVANYDKARAEIDRQLKTMHRNGQRRLRIPIYFGRGLGGGTVLDSTGGDLAAPCRENLTNLLRTIRKTGFKEIIVGFFPMGPNEPSRWTVFQQDYYEENWALIRNLRPLIIAATIRYRIDLGNEGIPLPRERAALEYCQRLWNRYAAAYGTRDTVGFSIIPSAERLQLVSAVYGDSPFGNHGEPPALDLHFYREARKNFELAAGILRGAGHRQPWILGECFFNDAEEAEALRHAIRATGQPELFLLQWPLRANSSCRHVDVAPPLDFEQYQSRGF
jgi:hypothetical protein